MIRLTTLGALDLRDGSGPIRELLTQPKRLALLVFLAVEGRRGPISRDRLLAMFWPESDTAHARNTLSQALHQLRQALGADVIESRGAGPVEIATSRLTCDATELENAIDRGETAAAVGLSRGEFCPGLFVSATPEFEQWLDAERRRFRDRGISAARTEAERLLAAGDAEAAARMAQRALDMHPDERDVRALLGLLDAAGNSTGALLAYQTYAKRLAEDLEMEPAAETQQLAARIRGRRSVIPREPSDPVPDEKQVEVQIPRFARDGKVRRAAVATAAFALVAIASSFVVSRISADDLPPSETVAVFPFTVRGAGTLAYLGDGMVDLLSAKLDGVTSLKAADPRSVIAASRAAEQTGIAPREIARRLGARHYITGDVVEIAGRLQINGALHVVGTEGRPIATATVTGDTTGLFQLVDDLTGRMLAGLSTGRDTAITRLAAMTTHSLPALKAFLEGEQSLRAGLEAAAAAGFRDAVMLDSTFALAQYRLAITATWVNVPDATDPNVLADRAARHAARLTPLVRDLLVAYQGYRSGRADEAEAGYRGLTAAHPEHTEAWLMLGETWFHYNPFRARDPRESRRAFERVLELDPGNAHAMIHLARLAAADGRSADLDALAARYRARYSDAERSVEMDALRAFLGDDPVAQAAAAAAAHATADDIVAVGVFQAATMYAQNPAAARDLVLPFTRTAGHQVMLRNGRRFGSELGVAQGRWNEDAAAEVLGSAMDRDWWLETEALLAAELLVEAPRERIVALREAVTKQRHYPLLSHRGATSAGQSGAEMQNYLAGLLSVRLSDSAGVSRALRQLEQLGNDTRRTAAAREHAIAMAHGLRAEMARTAGSFRAALAELDQMPFAFPGDDIHYAHAGVRERLLRADILRGLGRDDDALSVYGSFLTGYDMPFIAPAHLASGAIAERLGRRDRAVFHYARFARMWSNSDAEFQPLVARARHAIVRLGGESTR